MSHDAKLERITITMPSKLAEQVQSRVERGGYASVSEWIRYAIREQLGRERGPMAKIAEEDPRLLESLLQAKRGDHAPLDLSVGGRKGGE